MREMRAEKREEAINYFFPRVQLTLLGQQKEEQQEERAIAGALQRLLDGFGSVECGDERLDGVQSGGEGGERGGRGEVVVLWQAGARHVEEMRALPIAAHPRVSLLPLVDRMDMWVARALSAFTPSHLTPPSPHHPHPCRFYNTIPHGAWRQVCGAHGFVERMDLAYAPADVVVARAGAVTCSELLTTPTPCILIPSPHVAADHQTVNARAMVQAGAAVMLPQDQLSPHTLLSAVTSLLADGARREKMEECAGAATSANAADVMAQEVLRLALQQQQHRKQKAKFA
ncbi:unnamed protein product [Closterium sp. NIES-65]|nr:unnamed protein product [Closterium sp. NIES-65]